MKTEDLIGRVRNGVKDVLKLRLFVERISK